MGIVDYIETLQTTPRHQEEEYEYTSDFLEWFYMNVYLLKGCQEYPQIYRIVDDSEYDKMKELCRKLISIQTASTLDSDTIHKAHEELKNWTIDTLLRYDEGF